MRAQAQPCLQPNVFPAHIRVPLATSAARHAPQARIPQLDRRNVGPAQKAIVVPRQRLYLSSAIWERGQAAEQQAAQLAQMVTSVRVGLLLQLQRIPCVLLASIASMGQTRSRLRLVPQVHIVLSVVQHHNRLASLVLPENTAH
jgi:hypothetical protein